MAPERTPRPGGISLPGMRNSALATAALTSVALLSQTTGAAAATGDDSPSRDEVQQRVNSLYDRAENDTGTYNATRAGKFPRQRGAAPADGERRTAAPAGTGSRQSADPALAEVTRQWFEAARDKVGPTLRASLPADRTPARPAAAPRPTPSAERPAQREPLALENRTTSERAVPDPTAGSSVPALPSAPETWPDALRALPAADDPGRSPLHAAKERNRQKLERARALLATAQSAQSASTQLPGTQPLSTQLPSTQLFGAEPFSAPPAVESRPVEDIWQTAPQQAIDETGPQWLAQPETHPQAQPQAEAPYQADFTASFPDLSSLSAAPDYPPAYAPTATPDLPVPPADPLTAGLPFIPSPAPAPAADFPVTPAPAPAVAPPVTPAPVPMADLTAAPNPATMTGLPAHTADSGYGTKAAKVVDFARAQIGRPCVWGASGPGSYDCSGLTQAAWKAAGVALPRTAQAQASVGTVIPLTDLREGDLVFFHDDLSHVGVYTGNGMMVHAPGPGAYIREEPLLSVGESAIRGAVRTV
ncbi:NlpC/P60 family protein [Streptomyces sp. YU58]|uniref:C40 family peptidase n=1 Tax=Streptomyces sp. SX92 TaxID=3158972 RepID=UPI0027BA5A54|nr:NlpC/P60 family protein [Streptomyces coralus]WLW57078.1 NlpC/P60 family protein [Streptomyces coralus]